MGYASTDIADENDRLRRAAQQIGDVIARNAGLIE